MQIAFRQLDRILKAPEEHGAIHIYAGNLEHDRHRLHTAVRRTSLFKRNARTCGHVAVAGRIDHHFAQDRFPTGFALCDYTRNAVSLHNDIAEACVQLYINAGLHQHIQHQNTQFFRIDDLLRFTVACLFAQLFKAAAVLSAGPMTHNARGCHAADRAVLLDQHRFSSHACCVQGGAETCGAATYNKDFRFCRNRDLPARLSIILHLKLLFNFTLFFAFFCPLLPCRRTFQSKAQPAQGTTG